jgi:membrane fusion protein, multidrug efflux system
MRRAIVTTTILAAALAAAGCKPETKAPEPVRPALSTVLEPVRPDGIALVGTVEPRFKSDLGFRLLGRLVERPVNVGDSVAPGQTIAALDSTALELAVRSARAELAKQRAHLANATGVEDRQRTLIASNTTTKAMLESAEETRTAAESAVASAEAELAKASEQLGYARLTSDFAGIVTAVGAEVGQVVQPGQTVVTVARTDIREAVVDIGPDFPVPLRVGLAFTVSLLLQPDVQIEGRIREIAPQADAATRMRRVRIALTNPPPSFRLGATIKARLGTDLPPVLRVPASAILTRDGADFVWVVDLPTGTVLLRKVVLSREDGELRAISGLDAGTRVVTAGIHSLTPGQHVRIEQDATP